MIVSVFPRGLPEDIVMKLNQKDWSCPKKQRSRFDTIIEQYRKNFAHSLPPEKQHWTMCGQCSTATGDLLLGCEPIQMIESGLIKPAQFRGVEINTEIHDLNVKAFPELTFINNDFYRAIADAIHDGDFNPGIVNADFPATPDGAVAYIAKLMSMLTSTASDFLLIVNLILRMRYYTRKDGDHLIKLLNEYPQFRFAWNSGGWELCSDYYEYNGAGETGSRTYMGSFIFVRKDYE